MCQNLLVDALSMVAKDFVSKTAKIQQYAQTVERLLEAGVALELTKWDLSSCRALEVKRTDLPKLRKVVGRMEMTGKNLAWDYDSTHNVVVYLKPVHADFAHMQFCYRAPLKGTKCHVEETVHTSKQLVCKI